VKSRLRSNRDLSLYKPQAKLEKLQRRAKLMAIREQITKDAKEAMDTHELEHRLQRIHMKESKLELRLRKDEVQVISRAWFTCIAVTGLAFNSYKIALNRKHLHIRSDKVLKFFLIMAITVGKLRLKLRRFRAKAAFVKLQPMRRHITRWIAKHKTRFARLITDNIENSMTRNMLTRLMFEWRSRLLKLQRGMLYCLLCKKVLYKMLVKQWEALPNARKEPVPAAIKVIFIRQAIKDRLQVHNQSMSLWRAPLIPLKKKQGVPSKPAVNVKFTREELLLLDANARLRSNRWDYMLHKDKQLKLR
jgi:hypothetical protein